MEANGGDGQAVADKATVDGVDLPVGQGEARIGVARVGLLVDEGEARAGAAEVVLLVDEGEAYGGAAEVVLLVNDNGGEACGGAAEVGLPDLDIESYSTLFDVQVVGVPYFWNASQTKNHPLFGRESYDFFLFQKMCLWTRPTNHEPYHVMVPVIESLTCPLENPSCVFHAFFPSQSVAAAPTFVDYSDCRSGHGDERFWRK